LKVLMIGDIVGQPGRKAVRRLLPELKHELGLDMVIANGENVAGGLGLTPETAQELFQDGVDILTGGNHIWDKKEIIPFLDGELPIIRPLNYPPAVPGKGYLYRNGVLVVNLIGRTFIGNFDDPFRSIDALLDQFKDKAKVIIVDFHAEATSEKCAMGWYLDGRVSVMYGTHTHVPTADARLLLKGTAYVTDVGMVGPRDSVIGDNPEDVIQRFLTQMYIRLNVATTGPVRFNSILVDIDDHTGKALSIARVDREL